MFDDLHDPDPPSPDVRTLATVSRRARQMRQRRVAVTGCVAAGLLAVVGVAVFAGGDDPGSVSITADTDGTSTPATGPVATTDGAPGTTDPPSTDVPGETTVATDRPLDCPAVGLTYIGAGLSMPLIQDVVLVSMSRGQPEDQGGPSPYNARIVLDEGGDTVEVWHFVGSDAPRDQDLVEEEGRWIGQAPVRDGWVVVRASTADRARCLLQATIHDRELEMLEKQAGRPLVAIDGAGDAVTVAADGTTTLLHDGTDPDDPAPEEGEVVLVDGAVVDAAGNAWVGLCCEPVSGATLQTTVGTPATYEQSGAIVGHAPVLSPDDRLLATIDTIGVQVRDVTTDALATIDLQGPEFAYATRLVWTATDVLAVQIDTDTERAVALYSVIDGVASELSRTVVASGTPGAPWLVELVGVSGPTPGDPSTEPVVWLWNEEESALVAHGLTNLFAGTIGEGVEVVPVDPDATVVSVIGPQVRWVDRSRRLWVAPLRDELAGSQVPGEHVWVG